MRRAAFAALVFAGTRDSRYNVGMKRCSLLLLLCFAAASAAAEGEAKADDAKPRLTPFEWKKTGPDSQAEAPAPKGPRLKLAKPDPAKDDELVCEQGVVYPTSVPGQMGVRHCWKKSEPRKIIERPFNFMTADDLRKAQSDAAGFPPLKKPRIAPAKAKPAKKHAPAAAAAPAPAEAPAPAVTPAAAPPVDVESD